MFLLIMKKAEKERRGLGAWLPPLIPSHVEQLFPGRKKIMGKS